MNRLLLIDGSSLLSTSFFGNVPREFYAAKTEEQKQKVFEKVMKTSSGVFTNGVYTMSKILMRIIEKQKPTHIVVAWDVNRISLERKKKFDGYKANRQETMPELGSQFGLMQEVLDAMNIPQFKLEGHEADDIIGTFAKKFEDDIFVYILTKDQDALQLISERTRVWLSTSKANDLYKERGLNPKELSIPDGVFEYTPITFEEVYGLKPIQIVDLKSLEGDSSDNIPGVKGVGSVTALALLQEFVSIENLYKHIEDLSKEEEDEMKEFFKSIGIKKSPLGSLLKESDDELVGKKAALLSKELATIKTDLTEFDQVQLDDLKLELNREKTRAKFEELEFKSLLEKI